MKYLITFTIAVIIFISGPVFSQNIIWSNHFGTDRIDGGVGKCSNIGEYFTAGRFGGNQLITSLDTLIETINGDLFLSKTDNTGTLEWINQMKNYSSDPACLPVSVSILLDDTNQVIYIAGMYCSTLEVDSFSILSEGSSDIFIAKFDFEGNCIWLKSMGSVSKDYVTGMTIDENNHLYLIGRSNYPINFDSLSCNPGSFIMSFDSSGDGVWLKNLSSYFQGVYDYIPIKIKYNNNQLILTGEISRDSALIDTLHVLHIGYNSNTVCAFDLSGNIIWAKSAKCPNASILWALSIDNIGNIYIAGTYTDTLIYENQVLNTNLNQTNMYVMKLTSTGDYIWHKVFMSNDWSLITDIEASPTSSLILTGILRDTVTFDTLQVIPSVIGELFFASYDSSGVFHNLFHSGEISTSRVSVDAVGNSYFLIQFYNSMNIDQYTFTSSGMEDILVFKYDLLSNIPSIFRNSSNKLLIYTNPTKGQSIVHIPGDLLGKSDISMTIYSMSGDIIQKSIIDTRNSEVKINLESEAKGIYNIILETAQQRYVGKIIFE